MVSDAAWSGKPQKINEYFEDKTMDSVAGK
jgi:hypothetical protein